MLVKEMMIFGKNDIQIIVKAHLHQIRLGCHDIQAF